MKKIFTFCILLFCMPVIAASKTLTVDVSFAGPLSFNKTIKVNPVNDVSYLLAAESKLRKNKPVTLAMLMKVTHADNNEIILQFHLMSYGYQQKPQSIAQPTMSVKSGQFAEMKTANTVLKVKAVLLS